MKKARVASIPPSGHNPGGSPILRSRRSSKPQPIWLCGWPEIPREPKASTVSKNLASTLEFGTLTEVTTVQPKQAGLC